ncbi:MAG: radical SAM protein [Rhodospirillaceae bacterium]|jgi:MoaA/NifB/PqqE/SkfB family radical SAM enzyme|nr:radical SAM protein [Rhodospirillaceae bacterium]
MARVLTPEDIAPETEAEGHIVRKIQQRRDQFVATTTPSFPRALMMEISNICNHACGFCALAAMNRPKQLMPPELFRDIVAQAFAQGVREAALGGGAEPLACKHLEDYVAFCKDTGYDYVYITTNGSIADAERWRRLIEAGLDSIKVSINGGTRESYLAVHGKDDFEAAIASVRAIDAGRKELGRKVYLGISFVEMAENEGTFETLIGLLSPYVDEILHSRPVNVSGYNPEYPPELISFQDGVCFQPFSRIHVSSDGYLRACCVDYDNNLAIEDLAETPLYEAWVSERFQELRQRLMDNREDPESLTGLICQGCIHGGNPNYAPFNSKLATTVEGSEGDE